MTYCFTIISDEVDDFELEISIDSESTFEDLHKAIQKAAGYSGQQLTSFFICDDSWEKETEITLEDMSMDSENDSYLMSETKLSEFLEEEKQKLIYVFDYIADRCFFIRLSHIRFDKETAQAVCTHKEGHAPQELMDIADMDMIADTKAKTGGDDMGENFYGSDGYDMEDIDKESFEGFDDYSESSSDSSDIY